MTSEVAVDGAFLVLVLALACAVLRDRGRMAHPHRVLIVLGVAGFVVGAVAQFAGALYAWRVGAGGESALVLQGAWGYLPGLLFSVLGFLGHLRASREKELEAALTRLKAAHDVRHRMACRNSVEEALEEAAATVREVTGVREVEVVLADGGAASALGVKEPPSVRGFPAAAEGEELAVLRVSGGEDRGPLSQEQALAVELVAQEVASFLASRRKEEALREQRALWEGAFYNSPVGAILMDGEGRFLEYNRAMEEVSGYSREETPDHEAWCRAVSHGGGHLEVLRSGWRQVVWDEEARAFEVSIVRSDGEERQVAVRAHRIGVGQGTGSHHVVTVEDLTEQDRAFRALNESRQLYAAVVDNTPSGICVVDAETGELLFVNRTLHEMCGYTPGGERELTIYQAIASSQRSELMVRMAERMRGRMEGKPYVYEVVREDGSSFPAEVTSALATWRGRTAFVAVVTDITERRRAQEALERQFRELSVIFNAVDAVVYVADLETCEILYANEPCLRDFGPDVVGRRCFEALHGRSEGRCGFCPNSRLVVNGQAQPPVVWELRNAVSGRWYQCIDQAVPWTDGRLVHLQIALDITELKQTEQALSFQTELTDTALRRAPVGVTVVATDGTVLLWNDCQAEAHGVAAEAAEGKRLREVLGGSPAAGMIECVEDVLGSGRPFVDPSWEFGAPNGTPRVINLAIYPLTSAKGEVVGATVLEMDVTEHRAAEERLRQASKMEALGKMAGGVAHDFRNLLTAISGNLSLASADAGVEVRPLLQDAEQATNRASGLVRQLLTFARQTATRREAVSLSSIASEAVALMRRTLGAGMGLELETPGEEAVVEGDPDQLHRVVMNLLINARDAITDRTAGDGAEAEGAGRTGAGRIKVRLGTTEVGEVAGEVNGHLAGRFVVLSVADDGCGMDEQTRQHLFEPFFTTKSEGRGTGLGMATVYGIVRQHNGWIEVDSRVGEGTTMGVFLPQAQGTPVAEPAPEGGRRTGQGTVLLVDDEEMIRDLAQRTLKRLGYTVLCAGNGRQALETLENAAERIDLVLLDLTMPEMSGREVLQRLRLVAPAVKVIVCTGLVGVGEEELAFDDPGVYGVLAKPFSLADLSQHVAAALADGKDGPAPPPSDPAPALALSASEA